MAKLSVLGLGLRCPEQTSLRCLQALRESDRLFLISDNLDKLDFLSRLNPDIYNLMVHYGDGKARRDTYQEMADQVLHCLRQGRSAALVSYGHPLVFCDPSRLAIEQTAQEGFEVDIVPGVSSIDCLLADLRVDVLHHGLQIYEGHDLLLHAVAVDPQASQVIFQVPSLGDSGGGWKAGRFRGFIRALAEKLAESFGWDHSVVLYFGSNSPDRPTRADRVPLSELHRAQMINEYTLWVPPLGYAELPPELGHPEGPRDLILAGSGPTWGDRTQEFARLTEQLPVYSLQPMEGAQCIQSWEQLPADGQPKMVVFAGHPCSSGAVDWARAAHDRGWSFRLVPAVSWEDAVYCHVPLDPGLLGFQSFPAGNWPPLPVNLATLVRLPAEPQEGSQYWGPQSAFSPTPQPDSLALYLAGPDPRPLDNQPFLRALELSAVERLVAFLESQPVPLQKRSSPQLWLHSHLQMANKTLREALQTTDLGQVEEGRWAEYLLQNPSHEMTPYLMLRLRCEEALQAVAQGVSTQPLSDWIGLHP
jgi:precorrin-6B methylase 1